MKKTDTRSFAADDKALCPGGYLKSVREKKGVGRKYIQNQLGLSNSLFDALENDDLQRLPSSVFVRGYLKRYAELVGERVAPVLSIYQALLVDKGLVTVPVEEPPPRPVMALIGSALAFLLATSLVFGAILVEDSGDMSDESEILVESVTSTHNPGAIDAENRAGNAFEPAEVVSAAGATENSTSDKLYLSFVTDSWVEVVDARDHILAVSLQREGTQLALEGKPPFSVTLSYGPGVEVSYLGETVVFEHDAETFSADFVIGK